MALGAPAVLAQEIGTEIPANQGTPPPASSTPPSYDNPYGQPARPATPPANADTAAPSGTAPAMAGTHVPGPRKGAFGLRGSFGGAGVPVASSSTTVAGSPTPTIGLKFMATDSVGLNFDLGLGLGVGRTLAFGFGLGFGVDAYLGSNEKPIRPFITGGVGFGKALSPAGDDFLLDVNLGAGAEYWFSDYFSLNARALLGLPLNLDALTTVSTATFQPGLGATFYF